jgi:hypothetical protein
MSEIEQTRRPDLDRAQGALDKVKDLAELSRETYRGEDFEGHIKSLFVQTYDDLILTKPGAVDTGRMLELTAGNYFSGKSAEIRSAVSGLKIPGTDIPMFLGGGSYALFSSDGKLAGYTEDREGFVYGDNTENPHNAAPYTVSKPLALFMFRALGRELDISDQGNSDLIWDLNGVRLHMGGIPVRLPMEGGKVEDGILGISSAELTPNAIKHLQETFISAGAEHSIDPSGDEGHFTAAGFMDELAGRVVEAHFNGKTREEQQGIADAQWARLLKAGIPGPLPGQYH